MGLDAKSDAGDFVSFEGATEYLEQACTRFGVRHLSYWYLSLEDGLPDQVTWIATYDPNYMRHYMSTYTPLGDPVFEAEELDGKVIDWSEFSAGDATAQSMHAAAAKYGIGRYGLSYRFTDGPECKIMFSVNANCSGDEWPVEQTRILAWFGGFARNFHRRAKAMVEARQSGRHATAA